MATEKSLTKSTTDEPVATEKSDPRPETYFWATDTDEIRRAFIIDVMSDADIDGKVLVENMEVVFQWLKSGEIPKKSKAKLQPMLRGSADAATG